MVGINELDELSGIIGWTVIATTTIAVALAVLFYYKKNLMEMRQIALEADMDVDTGVSNEIGFLKHLTELVCSPQGRRALDVSDFSVCMYVFHIMYEPRASSFERRLIVRTVVRSLRANARSADLVGRLTQNAEKDMICLAFAGKKSLGLKKMKERMEKARRAVYDDMKNLPHPIRHRADVDERFFFLREDFEEAIVFLNRARTSHFNDIV